jgi:molybdopterin molybdotransferase
MALLPWREIARQAAALAHPPAGVEMRSVHGAAGRVLADDVRAANPLPAESHAVMDGYALGALPPGTFRIVAPRPVALAIGEAASVSAGDIVPKGAAAVVLAARATIRDGQATVAAPVLKDNIRRAGEEAAAGAIVLRAGTQLDVRHLALAAAAGVKALPLRPRPRVALLGVQGGGTRLPHLGIMAALLGGPALRLTDAGAVAATALDATLARLAAVHDLVIVVGDSLGDESGPLATALGGEARVRRAALKPAKPVILGRLDDASIVGLSGTAYAVTVAAHLFLRPLLRALTGLAPDDPFQPAIAAFSRPREPGRAEALPVRRGWSDGRMALEGSGRFGQLSALAALDGFALIEAEAGDVTPGAEAAFHPLMLPLV